MDMYLELNILSLLSKEKWLMYLQKCTDPEPGQGGHSLPSSNQQDTKQEVSDQTKKNIVSEIRNLINNKNLY